MATIDFHTVRNHEGRYLKDDTNPRVWKCNVNDTHLGIVVKKISDLNDGMIAQDKIVIAITIARDRLKNYIDEGGSLNKIVKVKKNGILVDMTVDDLQKEVKSYLKKYSAEVAAYDAAEISRIRNQYGVKNKGY